MPLILRAMKKSTRNSWAGAIVGVKTIMWCLIKADRLGASTKKYKRIPGGLGLSTRARTQRRRTMASPQLSTEQSKNSGHGTKK
jgi:hypothetical protein